jgi:glycosyltransferase involved in cell wall biosynthesis
MFPGRPVHIIANGVDLDRFTGDRLRTRKILGIADDAQVIGAAGRLEWVKGHDILIRAVAMLDPKSILFILGDGSRRAELQALALTLGVAGRIQFLGHRDDAAALLPALDVFCQPSRSEGLPLAILEAQACGVPVIASNVGDMAAAICPESGRLTPPEDVPALAAALRATLGRNALASPRAFVASRFDWRRTLNGYAKLLEA